MTGLPWKNPARVAHETAPLGSEASAQLYSMPGIHLEHDGPAEGGVPDSPEAPDR